MAQHNWVPDDDVIAAVILAFEEGNARATASLYVRDMVTHGGLVDAARITRATMLYLLRPEVQITPQIREAIRQSAIQREFIRP